MNVALNMKISASALEYPNPGIDAILKKAKTFGVDYLEIGILENLRRQSDGPDRIGELLREYGVKVSAVNTASLDLVEEAIDLAVKWDSQYVIVRDNGIETQDTWSKALTAFKKRMKRPVQVAKESGITLVLENGTAGITRTPEGMLEVVEAIGSPAFRVNYDPNNFYNAGREGFPYGYELLREHIRYVHVKDSTKHIEGIYGSDLRVLHRAGGDLICVPVGQGATNWEGLLARLKSDGYSGFLAIEPHREPEKMDDMFIQAVGYLRAKIQEM